MNIRGGRIALHSNVGASLVGVGIRNHPRRRLRSEVRIREVDVAIRIGSLHGFRPDVDVIGPKVSKPLKIVAFEDVEDLRDGCSP